MTQNAACSVPAGGRRIEERTESFVSDMNARALTGNRRMGTDALMDMLASHMERRSNVIRIKSTDGMTEHIRSEMTGNDSILIYCRIGEDELSAVMRTFPEACVYRAQELCHQLPACIREHFVMSEETPQ